MFDLNSQVTGRFSRCSGCLSKELNNIKNKTTLSAVDLQPMLPKAHNFYLSLSHSVALVCPYGWLVGMEPTEGIT